MDWFRSSVGAMVLGCTAAGVRAMDGPGPVILEDGWVLERQVSFADPVSALINPLDGLIYVGDRPGDVYRIDAAGVATEIQATDDVAGLEVDPITGALFVSEDFPGNVERIEIDFTDGSSTQSRWVSGFHSGDDDPVGMTVVPDSYTGTLLTPGMMFSTDRGFNGIRDLWTWSLATPQGEVQVRDDDGSMVDPVDAAIFGPSVIIADSGGLLKQVDDTANVTPLPVTGATLTSVQGVVFDQRTGALYVLDVPSDTIYNVDVSTGVATPAFQGFGFSGVCWGGLNLYDDGTTQRLVVSSGTGDSITVFSITPPCSDADVAGPFGELNFFDVAAFIGLFNAGDDTADIAAPFGSLNFFDVAAYIGLFNAGCP
jgi:hypothetical protein